MATTASPLIISSSPRSVDFDWRQPVEIDVLEHEPPA